VRRHGACWSRSPRRIPTSTLEVLNLVLDKDKAAEYGVDRVPAIIIVRR
jgi:hypothetical protein